VVTLKEQEISSWTGGLRLNLDIVLSEENVQQDLHTLTQTASSTDAYRTAYARVQQRFGTVLLSTAPGHHLLLSPRAEPPCPIG
jgi:hypothetical protein